jgi:hypothetical protein
MPIEEISAATQYADVVRPFRLHLDLNRNIKQTLTAKAGNAENAASVEAEG